MGRVDLGSFRVSGHYCFHTLSNTSALKSIIEYLPMLLINVRVMVSAWGAASF